MKNQKILLAILLIAVLITGQVIASSIHSGYSATKYFAITYNFVPISIGYTMAATYSYDENGQGRDVYYITGSATINTNQSYLDLTEMISLDLNSYMYGTPLDTNTSSDSYAFTQKNFSPAQYFTSITLTPAARFNFIDDVVPSYGGSEQYDLNWPTRQSSSAYVNTIENLNTDLGSSINLSFSDKAYLTGRKVSELVDDGSLVAIVNGEHITKYAYEKALLGYLFSIDENIRLLGLEQSTLTEVEINDAKRKVLDNLIDAKLILQMLRSSQSTISNEVFNYQKAYLECQEVDDLSGIASLERALSYLDSYAKGLGKSLDEYLTSILQLQGELEEISAWKDNLIKSDMSVENAITKLRDGANIQILLK